MLEALRRAADSWVLKPLLILLVLAFIVWGVADVFTGGRTGALATVGSAQITTEEYQSTYSAVMNNFARRFGRRPTAEEARLRGVDRAVLEDLINSASLDQHARQLGLGLSQQTVASAIAKDPVFATGDGKFDRAAFETFLREIGFSERGYLVHKQREEIRQQLTQAMFQQLPIPAALSSYVHAWREETRKIQHFTIDPAKMPALPEPDETQLKEVYGAQQRQFMTPEYRRLGVLVVSAAEAKSRLEIKDEDIRRVYDQDTSLREVPERRRVQQLPVKDAAAAETAAKAIAGGRSFMDVAKDNGATESDIDLGEVVKTQLIDPKIADAAFALAKDKVSAPVTGRFTTVLLRVTEITPGKIRTLDELRDEIRGKLADARLNDAIRKLHDAVDDGRAAGKPLKEIAEAIKAKYYDLEQIDRVGRKPDGTQGYDGPDAPQVLAAGFGAKQGVETEAIDLADGGYAWVDLLGETPARQRPFEDIRDDVKAMWRSLENGRRVAETAAKMIERAGNGEKLSALAAEVGAKLETSKPFKRFGTDSGVPPAGVQRAFGLPLGGLASVESANSGQRMVFRLVEIEKAAPQTPEQADELAKQMRGELQQDIAQAYVTALREKFGVTINEQLFRRTIGETPETR